MFLILIYIYGPFKVVNVTMQLRSYRFLKYLPTLRTLLGTLFGHLFKFYCYFCVPAG